jgi:uncharacterized protein involved in exopolysaccharide biosynthesis
MLMPELTKARGEGEMPGAKVGAVAISEPGEISVRDLVLDVWRRKFVILVVAIICAALGATFGLMTGRSYSATALLSPVEDSSGNVGGIGELASQFGGLASLAGLNIAGGGKKQEAVAVLQSELLTEEYIKRSGLLPVLYAKLWDAQKLKWRVNAAAEVPTLWKANRLFRTQIRQVTQDPKTGLVELTIKWKDPVQAARWANDLVRLTNDYLRDKAIAESTRSIAYLNGQAAEAQSVEIRKTVYSVLEQELNKEMLARGREEFALKTIDPAFPPERPSSLGPPTLAVLGFLIGGLVAVTYLFGRRIFTT